MAKSSFIFLHYLKWCVTRIYIFYKGKHWFIGVKIDEKLFVDKEIV